MIKKKRVEIKILSILKLVSFKSLTGNDFSERSTLAEAQCERNLTVADPGEAPPYFWTKMRPEGPKKIWVLKKQATEVIFGWLIRQMSINQKSVP